MSLDAPAALLGALALPLLWWLHRRLSQPAAITLPSLMFLLDEEEQAALPRAPLLDAELVLTLLAAGLLVLAAAGPRWTGDTLARRVRVVVSAGAPLSATGGQERVDEALAALRADLREDDEVEVVRLPPDRESPRVAADSLLAQARAGVADLRYVLSDQAADIDTGEVRWVGVGSPGLANVGIVAATLSPSAEGRLSLFLNLVAQGGEPRPVSVQVIPSPDGAQGWTVDVAVGAHRVLETELQGGLDGFLVRLRSANDALAADDEVRFRRAALGVYLDPALPAALAQRVRLALEASAGPDGVAWIDDSAAVCDLGILPDGSAVPTGPAWLLQLAPPGEPGELEYSQVAPERRGLGLARDLSSAAAQWAVTSASARLREGEEVLLEARFARGALPILVQHGRRLRLCADALRGEPAPVATAFWPLLLENLAQAAAGGATQAPGWRVDGLLHAPSSALGGHRTPVSVGQGGLPVPRPRPPTRLRPWLGVLAVLSLAALWLWPSLKRGRTRGRSSARSARAA